MSASARYVLAHQWLLRRDAGLARPNTLYDITTGRSLCLSDGAYLATAVWEHNEASPDEVTAFLDGRGAGLPPDEIGALSAQLATLGALVPAPAAAAPRGRLAHQAPRTAQAPGAPRARDGQPPVPVANAPYAAEIHPTRRCNLACRHCAYDAPPTAEAVLPLPAWVAIIDELEALRTRNVVLSGGEPLLYPAIDGLIDHLAGKRLRVDLLTNGTLISPARARALARPHFSVTVSLDGPDAATHDWLRGPGAFARVCAGLDQLARHGATRHIAATIHRRNLHAMDELVRVGIGVGARSVNFVLVDEVGRAARARELWLAPDEAALVVARARELGARHRAATRVSYLNSLDPARQYRDLRPPGPSDPVYCTAGTTRIAIRWDGAVHPCVYSFSDDEFVAGRAPASSIADIWASPRWRLFRGSISLGDLRECAPCPEAAACTLKLCRLRARYARGDVLAAPPGCPRPQPQPSAGRATPRRKEVTSWRKKESSWS